MFIFAQFTYVLAPTLVLAMLGLHAIPAKSFVPYEGPSILHSHLLKVLAIVQMMDLRALLTQGGIEYCKISFLDSSAEVHQLLPRWQLSEGQNSCVPLFFLLSCFCVGFHCREDAI